ncbi:823_t:CDS:1, partial [Diversispora eburnea]
PQIGTDEQTLNRNKEILTELAKTPSTATPHFPPNLVNNITSAATAFLDCFELLNHQNQAIGQSRKLF